MNRDNRIARIIIGVVVVGMLLVGGMSCYYYSRHTMRSTDNGYDIRDFDEARDLPQMLEIFEQDKYWLTSNPNSRPDIMFRCQTPDIYRPDMYGKMAIKVAWKDNKVVGFTTFYKKNFYTGKILFLEVQADYRKHGYGQKLLESAFDVLRSWGMKRVQIVTRPSNDRALRLYKRVGFQETKRDENYVWLAQSL